MRVFSSLCKSSKKAPSRRVRFGYSIRCTNKNTNQWLSLLVRIFKVLRSIIRPDYIFSGDMGRYNSVGIFIFYLNLGLFLLIRTDSGLVVERTSSEELTHQRIVRQQTCRYHVETAQKAQQSASFSIFRFVTWYCL